MASRSGTQASPPAKKMAYFPKLESQAADSPDFRRVLWTGEHSQLVIMTIPVDGEIGEEVHTVDQHLFFYEWVRQSHCCRRRKGSERR
ncbi:hypothetical protein RSOLAG22IIIB_03187 [Rhizoctonia solani]|uniref:Uncharacterized protein n=1 Tax=Rhizoctonia solani TaxID=456999 RepID=A0A0K6FNB0_9AGAM|nr:hypothetical protein RSOLAG22IIIB_03187 [Rhizoctonia solani]